MAGLSTTGTPIVQVYHEKSRILPDVSRVLACLYEKDIKFQTHTASYKSLLKLQASTHAPVPFYDGPIFLEESREICRHIAEKYEHFGYPFLLGKDALERASVEQWLHNEEHAFNPPSRALFCHLAFPPDKEDNGDAIDMHVRKLEDVLEVYEQRLSDSEFLAGNMFTLADLVHIPNSHYITASDKFVYLYDSRKNVRRWWDAISTRYSWQQVLMYMKSVEEQNKQEKTTTYDASSDQLAKGHLHEHIGPTAPTHEATEPIHDRRTLKNPQLRGGSQAEAAHAERESSLSDKKTAGAAQHLSPVELFRQETRPSAPIIRGVSPSDSQSVTRKIQEVTPDYGHPGKPLIPRQDNQISHASQEVPHQEDMKYSQGTRDSQKSDILRASAKVTRDEASEKQGSYVGSAFRPKESGATAPSRAKYRNDFDAEGLHKKDTTDEEKVVSPLWNKEPTSQVQPPSEPSQEAAPGGDLSSKWSTLEQWKQASTQLKGMTTTYDEQRVETPILPIEPEPSRVQITSPSFPEAPITDHGVVEDKFVKQSTIDERSGRSKQIQQPLAHAPLASPTKRKIPDGPEVADLDLVRSSQDQMLDAAKAAPLGSATIHEHSHDVAIDGNATYDASSYQLIKGRLHEQTRPPAPTHEATEPIDDSRTSKNPRLRGGSQAEVAHAERKPPLSDKKPAPTAQHLSPVELFGQETRASAPNIRGVPPSDSKSVTRKIQEVTPDYGHPGKPLVPSQDDQISNASQPVPHQEDMKYTPGTRGFEKSDIQRPLAKVHEVTRDEASEKRGSYIGSAIGPKESGARGPSAMEQWQHASTPLKDMSTTSGEHRVETPILPIEPEASHVQSTSPSFPQAATTDLGLISDRFVKQSTTDERPGRSKQMQAPVTDAHLASTTKRKTPYGPEVADLELVRSSESQMLDATKATPPGQGIVHGDSHDAAIDEKTTTYDAKSDHIKKPLHEQTWPPAPTRDATEPVDDRHTSKDPRLRSSSQAEVAKSTLSDKKLAHAAQHFPPVELFQQETRSSSPIIREVPASDNQSATRKIQEVTPDYGRRGKPLVPSQGDQISQASQAVPRQEDMKYSPGTRDFQKSDIHHPLAKDHEVTRDDASEKQGSYVGSSAIRPKESGARAPSRAKSRNDFDAEESHKQGTTDEQIVSPLWSKELTSQVQPPSGPSQDAASGSLSNIEQWQRASTPLMDMTTRSGGKRVEPPILPVEPEASGVQSTSPTFPEADTIDQAVIDDRVMKQSTRDERLSGPKQIQPDTRYSPPTKGKTADAPSISDLELVGSSEGQILDGEKATPPGPAIIHEDSHDAAMDEKMTTYDASSDQLMKGPLHEQPQPPAVTDEATKLIDDRRTSKDPPLSGGSHAEPKSTLSGEKPALAAQHPTSVEVFRQETRLSEPILTGVPPSDSQSFTSQDDRISHASQAVPRQEDMKYSQGIRHSQKSDIQRPTTKVHEVTPDEAREKQDSHVGFAFGPNESGATELYRAKSLDDFGTEESHKKGITDEQKVVSPLWSKEPTSQVQPPSGPSQDAASGGDLSSKMSNIEQWQRASMPLKDITTSSGEKRVEPPILPIEPEATGFQSNSPSFPEADTIDHAVVDDKVVKLSTRDERLSGPKQMQPPITDARPAPPPTKGKTADAPQASDLELVRSSEGQILDGEKATPPGPTTIREDSYDAAMDEKTTTYDASSNQFVKGPLHEQIWPPAPTHEGTEPIDDRRTSKDPEHHGGSQAEVAHTERKSTFSDEKPAGAAQHLSPVELFRQETRPSTPIIRQEPPSDGQSVIRKIQEVTPDYGHPGKPLVPSQDDQISHASQEVPRQEDMKYSQGTRHSQKSDIQRPPAKVHEVTHVEASENQGSHVGSAFGPNESGATAPYRAKSLDDFGAEESHKKDITDEQKVISPLWSKEPTSQVQAPPGQSQDAASRGDLSSKMSNIEQWQRASTPLKDMTTSSGEERVEPPILPIEPDASGVQSTSPSFPEADPIDQAVIDDTVVKQSTRAKRPSRPNEMQPPVTDARPVPPTKGKTADATATGDLELVRSYEGQILDPEKAKPPGLATMHEDSHDAAMDEKATTSDASSDQLVKGPLHQQARPPAPTHEARESIDDHRASKDPQFRGSSQAEAIHAQRKSTLSDKKPAHDSQHPSPVEPVNINSNDYAADDTFVPQKIFQQETRPSAPIVRGVPALDSESATRKSQEVAPDYGRPGKPPVQSQGDQISHASQAIPRQEDMKFSPGTWDSQTSDIKGPSAHVLEVTRDELSEKQGVREATKAMHDPAIVHKDVPDANMLSNDVTKDTFKGIKAADSTPSSAMPIYTQKPALTPSMQTEVEEARDEGRQSSKAIPEHLKMVERGVGTSEGQLLDHRPSGQEAVEDVHGATSDTIQPSDIRDTTKKSRVPFEITKTPGLTLSKVQPFTSQDVQPTNGEPITPTSGQTKDVSTKQQKNVQDVFQPSKLSGTSHGDSGSLSSVGKDAKIAETNLAEEKTFSTERLREMLKESESTMPKAHPSESTMPKAHPGDSGGYIREKKISSIHQIIPAGEKKYGSTLKHQQTSYSPRTLDEKFSASTPERADIHDDSRAEVSYRKDTSANQKVESPLLSQKLTSQVHPSSEPYQDAVPHGDLSSKLSNIDQRQHASAPLKGANTDSDDTEVNMSSNIEQKSMPISQEGHISSQHANQMAQQSGEQTVEPPEHAAPSLPEAATADHDGKFVKQSIIDERQGEPKHEDSHDAVIDEKTTPYDASDDPLVTGSLHEQARPPAPTHEATEPIGGQNEPQLGGSSQTEVEPARTAQMVFRQETRPSTPVTRGVLPLVTQSVTRKIQEVTPDNSRTDDSGKPLVPSQEDHILHASQVHEVTPDESSEQQGSHVGSALGQIESGSAINKFTPPEVPSSAEPSKGHPVVPTAKEIKALPTVISQQGTPETREVPTSNDALDTVSTHGDVHSTTSTRPPRISFSVQEVEPTSSAEAPPFHVAHDTLHTGTTPVDALGNSLPKKPSASPGAQHGIAPGNNAAEVTPPEQKFVPSGQDSVHSKQSPPSTAQRNEVIGDSAPKTQQISLTDQAKGIPTTRNQQEMSAPLISVSPSSGTQRPSEKGGEHAPDDLRKGVSKPPSYIREVRSPRVVSSSAPAEIDEEVRDIQKFVPSGQDSVHSTEPPSYPEQRNRGIGNSAPSTQVTTETQHPGEEQVRLGQDEGHATEPYRTAIDAKTTTSPSSKAYSSESGSDLTQAHTETSSPEHGLLTQPPLATLGAPNKANSAGQEAKAHIASASETQPSSILPQYEVAPVEQNFVVSEQPSSAEPSKELPVVPTAKEIKSLPTVIDQQGTPETREVPTSKDSLDTVSTHGDVHSPASTKRPRISFSVQEAEQISSAEAPPFHVPHDTLHTGTTPDDALGNALPMKPASPSAQHGNTPGNIADEVTPAEHKFVQSGQDSVDSKQSPPFTVQRNEEIGDLAPKTQQISTTDQAKGIPTTLHQQEMSAPLRSVPPSLGTQIPSKKAREDASDDLTEGVSKPPSHVREVRLPRVVPASAPDAIGEEVRDIQKFVPSGQDSVHTTEPPSYPEQRDGGIENSSPSTQDTIKTPLPGTKDASRKIQDSTSDDIDIDESIPGEEQVPLRRDEGHATEPYKTTVDEKTTASPSSKAYSSESGSDLTHAHTKTSLPEHGILTQPPLATLDAPNRANSADQEAKAPIGSASETQPGSILPQYEVAPIEQNFVVSEQPSSVKPSKQHPVVPTAKETKALPTVIGQQGTPETREVATSKDALDTVSTHGDVHSPTSIKPPRISFSVQEAEPTSSAEAPPFYVVDDTLHTGTTPDDVLGNALPMKPSASPGAHHGIAPGNNSGEVTQAEHKFFPTGQDFVRLKQSPPFTVQRNEEIGDSAPETQQISSTDQVKDIPTTLDQEEMSAPLRSVSPSLGTQRPSKKAREDASDDLRESVSKPPSHVREVRPPRVVPASAPDAIGEEVRDIQKFVPSGQDYVHSTEPPSYPEQRNGGIGNSAPSIQDTTKTPLPGEGQVPLSPDEGHATEPDRAVVDEKTTTSPSSKAYSSVSGSDLTQARTETSLPEHGLLTQPPLATLGAPNKAKSAGQEAKAPIAPSSETQPSSIQSQDEVAPIEQNFIVSDQESIHASKSPSTTEPRRGETHTFVSAGQTNLPLAILSNQDTRQIPDAREALSKYQESSRDGDGISNLADPLVSQKEASHAERGLEGPTSEVRSAAVDQKTGPDSTLVTGDAYPTNADMLTTNSLQNQQAQPLAATQAPTPHNPAASSQNVHADSLANIETQRQPSKAMPASVTISTVYSDTPNGEPGTATFQTPQEALSGGEKNTMTQGDQVKPLPNGDLSTSHAIRPSEGEGFKGTNSRWKLEGAPLSEDNSKEPQKQSSLLKETMESSGKSERKEQAGKAIVQSQDGSMKQIEQTETHDTKTDVPEGREPQENTNRTNNKVSQEETLDMSGKQTSRVQMQGEISKDASDSIKDAPDSIRTRSNFEDDLRPSEESKVHQQSEGKSQGGETEAPRTDTVQQSGRDLSENSYQNDSIQSQAEGSDKSAEKFSPGIQNKNKTSSGWDSPTDGTKSGDAEDKSRQ